jgi:hypothetical protein
MHPAQTSKPELSNPTAQQQHRGHFAQFSTDSPAIRLNSRSLFLASVTSKANACAPIPRSVFPIKRPCSSKVARISPPSRFKSHSTASAANASVFL